jgi:hypothetical protein
MQREDRSGSGSPLSGAAPMHAGRIHGLGINGRSCVGKDKRLMCYCLVGDGGGAGWGSGVIFAADFSRPDFECANRRVRTSVRSHTGWSSRIIPDRKECTVRGAGLWTQKSQWTRKQVG